MTEELVRIERPADGVAVVTLERPDAMNALSSGLRSAITEAFVRLQDDEGARVAVLTGAGRAFCAGFDLKELGAGGDDTTAAGATSGIVEAMAAFSGPIIGAVNGHAITGGFELALACDLLVASTAARFADTHARVGILPGWGLSQKLPRLIGISRAKELSFTGNAIDAEQALAWGLVNRVVEPEALLPTAIELASDMASCVPQVLAEYKQLIDRGYGMHLPDALAMEAAAAVESAKRATAALIRERRDGVFDRGREQQES